MKMKKLHNHPELEIKLGVDVNHVIVDRSDWEEVFFGFPEIRPTPSQADRLTAPQIIPFELEVQFIGKK